MDDIIEKARKSLANLEVRAEELRIYLRVHEALTGDKVGDNVTGGVNAEDDPGTATPAQIVESAKAVMKERWRPLSRSMLVKLLTEKGLNLPGQDKNKNVGTVIWRSRQFDNLSGHGYWPKELGRWMPRVAPAQASLPGTNAD